MSKTIVITSGPSREELFDGLRLFAEKRVIGFTIENNGRQMTPVVLMQGIEPEDGGGQSWNIKFLISEGFVGKAANPLNPQSKLVKAYYSTRTRKGTITVE